MFAIGVGSSAHGQLPPALQNQVQPTAEEMVGMREAIVAMRAGKWDQAEKSLLEVVGRNPDAVTAFLYLGIVYRSKAYLAENEADREGFRQKAEDRLKEGLLIDPFEARVAYQLGNLLLETAQATPSAARKLEKLREAKDAYTKLILLAPMTREAHQNYAVICLEQLRLLPAGDPGSEERADRLDIADDGLMHAKLVSEFEQKDPQRGMSAFTPQLIGQLYQQRARLSESEEEREADLAESRRWFARTPEPGRGPLLKR